jgi:hypothetical protein
MKVLKNVVSRIEFFSHCILQIRRGYALCLSHLSTTLVGGEISKEIVLRQLQAMPEIMYRDGIYCLKGREKLIPETTRRLARNGIVGKKYEAQALLFASEYASLCPFIRSIAIAGSMASGVFSEEDYIDFNILVEDGFKYTVYLIGILLSLKYSFKHRKKPLACKSRTPFLPKLICINVIWEESEALPFVRQDAYMAYELLRQKPIFGIDFYRKILAKNMWLKTYFPQIYYRDSCETNVRKTLTARILHFIYTNYVVSKLGERMCKGTSTFLGGLYSSHAGITSKPSLCKVGD